MRDNRGRGPALTVVQGVQLHGGLSGESEGPPFFINLLMINYGYTVVDL